MTVVPTCRERLRDPRRFKRVFGDGIYLISNLLFEVIRAVQL